MRGSCFFVELTLIGVRSLSSRLWSKFSAGLAAGDLLLNWVLSLLMDLLLDLLLDELGTLHIAIGHRKASGILSHFGKLAGRSHKL